MKDFPSDDASGTPFHIVHPVSTFLVGLVASTALVSAGALVFGPVFDLHALAVPGVDDVGVAGSGRTAPAAAEIRLARADVPVGVKPAFP